MDYQIYMVGDTTITFDIVSANKKLIKAETLHQSILANIHATTAEVIDTAIIIGG
jgi:hypothetical protein